KKSTCNSFRIRSYEHSSGKSFSMRSYKKQGKGWGMNKILPIAVAAAFLQAASARAQQRTPLLPEPEVAALANELSGETAKRNLEGLARLHRQRGSAGVHAAAEFVGERARADR